MICPATEKHVEKYREQEIFVVKETAEDYKNITLPVIESSQFGMQVTLNLYVLGRFVTWPSLRNTSCYARNLLPHVLNSLLQWIYNLLEHKSEAERIIFEDPDKEIGFILAPDLKWDGKLMDTLYVTAIVHKHGIKSIR